MNEPRSGPPAPGDPNVLPDNVTTRAMPIRPPFPENRTPPGSSRRLPARNWAFGLLAVLLLAGTFAYYYAYPQGELPRALRGKEEVAPVLRPYLDRAAQGDATAMRMLGTMYYNGLNIPQDRKEGIRWYRKAAAAGNVAARKDLEQLGLAVDGK